MSTETKEQTDERLLTEFPEHTREEWREAVDKLLKGKSYEKIMLTKTYEGIILDPLYRKEDVAELANQEEIPGQGSYLRGTKAEGYQTETWKVAQEITCPTPKQFNEALLHDLNRGQTAVNIVLDEATKLGLDPAQSEIGKVGKNGLSVANMEDLNVALNDVVIDCIDIQIQAATVAMPMAAMLVAVAKKRNLATANLAGIIGMDPISELAEKGSINLSMTQAFDEMHQLTSWAKENAPKLRTISVNGTPYRNAGGSAVEELSFAFATAVKYIREMLNRGLTIDEIAPRMAFNLAVGANFFMEISKFRAARVMWSNIVEEFGGNAESRKIYIHARTSLYNKTTFDPYVNMLRTTTEAFSGVVGGVDSMHVGAFDEVVRVPDEFSRRISRNQQIMLAEECRLDHVIDPAGGSWYIENLTNNLMEAAWKNFQLTEEAEGILNLLEKGEAQKAVEAVAEARKANLSKRKDAVIGTNMFANMTETPLEAREWDYEAIYAERCEAVKTTSEVTLDKAKLMESVIEAFTNGATLNQVITALRGETAETTIEPLRIHRQSEIFEDLRNKVEAMPVRPKVFLANNGPVLQHKGRADFSRGFFEVAGFNVIEEGGFDTPLAAAEAALKAEAEIVVICSTDKTYPELVPVICQTVKAANPKIQIVLAGFPKDQIEAYKAAGVNEFIFMGAKAYNILSDLAGKVGVE